MFGWFALPSCLSKEISRRTDIGTPSSVSASFTFLMATILSLIVSRALYTVPYAPVQICRQKKYI